MRKGVAAALGLLLLPGAERAEEALWRAPSTTSPAATPARSPAVWFAEPRAMEPPAYWTAPLIVPAPRSEVQAVVSVTINGPGLGEHLLEVKGQTLLPAVSDAPAPKSEPKKAPPPIEPPKSQLRELLPRPRELPETEAVAPKLEDKPLVFPTAGVPFHPSAQVRESRFGSSEITVAKEPFLGVEHDSHGGPQRVFVRAEYLLWWLTDSRVPVLAATGLLGQSGTAVLFGPGDADFGGRSGARVTAGVWLDDSACWALDGSLFALGREGFRFAATSNQFARIVRPFFSANLNAEAAETVVAPGVATGGILISGSSRFWGTDLNLRRNCVRDCDWRIDVFAGLRYLELAEQLDIVEALTAGPLATLPIGTRSLVNDRFVTRNQFFGGQIGASLERSWERWSVGMRAAVALGSTHQAIDIRGSQVVVQPGVAPVFFVGGLLATPTNIGSFSRDDFAVMPELNLNVGYQLGPHVRLLAGYSFLYWSSVVRPGDQIDRVIDVAFVPNPPAGVQPSGLLRPALPFRQTELWAHGLNLGMELGW